MRNGRSANFGILFLLSILVLYSAGPAQLSVEVGPSYIVNLTGYGWDNTKGLNLSVNYKIAENLFINPKISLYKFLYVDTYYSPPVPLSGQDFFSVLSLSDDEIGFIDASIGLKVGQTCHFVNPIFSMRVGLHFIRYTDHYRNLVISPADLSYYGPYNKDKVSDAIGFGGAGFGFLFNLSERAGLLLESSFSSSFNFDYAFVPVDLTLRINL